MLIKCRNMFFIYVRQDFISQTYKSHAHTYAHNKTCRGKYTKMKKHMSISNIMYDCTAIYSYNKQLQIYIFFYSIASIKSLEVLSFSYDDLSTFLPDDAFTSLLSLRKLELKECKLSALPSRCVLYIIKLPVTLLKYN